MSTDDYERNRAKHASGLLGFMTAQFIWSLESQHDLKVHPSFADFASGLLWQHENIGGCTELPFTPQQLPEMKRRYPSRKLEGLEVFNWRPPRRQKNEKKPGERHNWLADDRCERRDDAGVDVQGEDEAAKSAAAEHI